jgi:hypothetical protein
MGANAQTSVPLFVANTVLTAATQNISAATGVPVFATTVTRDAAFGGSNKVLAEGQLCYIEASDVVQYYTGAAWATVGPATASAVTLIETLSPSNVATTQFATSSFSSTYKFYTIKYSFNNTFTFNLRSAGSTITAANYKRWRTGTVSTNAAFNSVAGGETSVPLVNSTTVVYPVNGTINTQSDCTVSGYQVFDCHQVVQQQSGATNAVTLYQAIYEANQVYDSLLFTGVTGNLTGTVKLYGWS